MNKWLPKRFWIMLKVKYIVWDFDGTLWQDDALGRKIKEVYLEYVEKNLDLPFSLEAFEILSKKYGSWSAAAASLTKKGEASIVQWVEDNFDKSVHISENRKLVTSIENLIKYKHLIMTNSSKREVEKGLVKIGFRKKSNLYYPFEKIFGREELGDLKPHFSTFRKVVKYTNKSPSSHLMVGDSETVDLIPARRIGFQATHINDVSKFLNI